MLLCRQSLLGFVEQICFFKRYGVGKHGPLELLAGLQRGEGIGVGQAEQALQLFGDLVADDVAYD